MDVRGGSSTNIVQTHKAQISANRPPSLFLTLLFYIHSIWSKLLLFFLASFFNTTFCSVQSAAPHKPLLISLLLSFSFQVHRFDFLDLHCSSWSYLSVSIQGAWELLLLLLPYHKVYICRVCTLLSFNLFCLFIFMLSKTFFLLFIYLFSSNYFPFNSCYLLYIAIYIGSPGQRPLTWSSFTTLVPIFHLGVEIFH